MSTPPAYRDGELVEDTGDRLTVDLSGMSPYAAGLLCMLVAEAAELTRVPGALDAGYAALAPIGTRYRDDIDGARIAVGLGLYGIEDGDDEDTVADWLAERVGVSA